MSDAGLRKVLAPLSPGISGDRPLVWPLKPLLHQRLGFGETLEMVRQFMQHGATQALDLVCRRPGHAPAVSRPKASSEIDAELAGRVYRNGLIVILVESRSALLRETTDDDFLNRPPTQCVQDFLVLQHTQHQIGR